MNLREAVSVNTTAPHISESGRERIPQGTLDANRKILHIVCVICSPLDQPKGLWRGFAFQGERCR